MDTTPKTIAYIINDVYKKNQMTKEFILVKIGNEVMHMTDIDTAEGRFEKDVRLFRKTDTSVEEISPFGLVLGSPDLKSASDVKRVFFRCFTKKSILEEYQKEVERTPHLYYGITGPVEGIKL